jgi:hypothetical protein
VEKSQEGNDETTKNTRSHPQFLQDRKETEKEVPGCQQALLNSSCVHISRIKDKEKLPSQNKASINIKIL